MPSIYPEDLYQQLEFDKLLIDLQARCISEPAKSRAISLPLLDDVQMIERRLQETSSYVELLSSGKKLILRPYRLEKDTYRWLEIQDSVLTQESILELRNQMSMVVAWFAAFDETLITAHRPVFDLLNATEPLPDLLAAITRILDDEGEVKDAASPDLKHIRKQIQSRSSALEHAFNKSLLHYRQLGYLADNLESYRSGRRVMAVLAEYKRKVNGIILDESSSGRTVFIEPHEATALDNEIIELRNEERREIRRILKGLTKELSEYLPTLKSHVKVITEVDLLSAKASQAAALDAQAPQLLNQLGFDLKEARHPLLLLKHLQRPEQVVPLDLALDATKHIVVISGPNAGGKTIALKTVGLLSLMLQSGLLIPASMESSMGVFEQFFVDIGDQQSLENDLSTYHSHLNNMRAFTDGADQKSFFLIDEFGAGTEPSTGGAIAEAILADLHNSKAYGVITTHYGNLKIFASNHVGIDNASITFDKIMLRPTFRLRQGTPGSSFAFQMAERSRLRKSIIQAAKKKMGKKEGRLEHLLTSLEKDKNELEKKLRILKTKEADLDRLIKSYDRMQLDLDVKKKRLKLEEKTKKLQDETRANKQLEKIIRQIREKEKLGDAKALSASLKESKKALERSVVDLKEEINQSRQTALPQDPFKVGDFVRIRSGDTNGMIERIEKDQVIMIVGNLKLAVPMKDLEHSRAPIDLNPTKSVKTHISAMQNVYHKLDIRGLRRAEALKRIENFIDKALVANLGTVEIIHGKGNGTLRTLVKEKLKEYDPSFEAYHPEANQGGEGVTLVRLQG